MLNTNIIYLYKLICTYELGGTHMNFDLSDLEEYIENVNHSYYKFAQYLFEMRGRSSADVAVNEYNSLIVFQYTFSVCMMMEEYQAEIIDGYFEFGKKLLINCPVGNEFDENIINDVLLRGNIYKKCYSYCKIQDDFLKCIFWSQMFAVVVNIPDFSFEMMNKALQLYYEFLFELERCIVKWKTLTNSVSTDYCTRLTTVFKNYLKTFKD